MDWKDILQKARNIKENFERSYKCLNHDRPIKNETVKYHLQNLLQYLEEIRILFNVNYKRLTTAHQRAADAFFLDLTIRITKIATKKGIDIELPNTIHEHVNVEIYTENNMSQTVVEFLNTASKLIPEFDGKSENLPSFIDSLNLVKAIQGTHESTAVSLIKTKLKGTARNLISSENTINEIIQKLKTSVKGESVEVLTAKIMNIKQNNKTANAYCGEIENLSKSLENAYICDGLPCELATKYSTQVAVKALTKNCTIDKVKLIMEAGQFNSMNDAISKFVNSCTEATGQQNAILYYRQRQNNRYSFFRGNAHRGRNNFPRNNSLNSRPSFNNNRQSNNFNNNNRYNQRPNYYRRNGNYIRATESNQIDSENQQDPLRESQ